MKFQPVPKEQRVNKAIVTKLIATIKPGLSSGLGEQIPGKMCVEAAVCYAYGLPHNDNPPCVGEVFRSYKIKLNDSRWSSNQIRAKHMLPLAIAQLGSIKLDQQVASDKLVILTINTIIADLAKKYKPELELPLRNVASKVEAKKLCTKLKTAAAAAYASAAYASAYAAYASAAKDPILIQASNNCLQVLKEMKSPGCKYLYLIEENQ